MEKELAVIRSTLELAMGADFFKAFHENKEKTIIIMRSLLPYQVWDQAQRRLIAQQERST